MLHNSSMNFAERRSISRLAEIASRPETVWYLGAGVSVGSGLPSWAGLLELLADFVDSEGQSSAAVRREIERPDYLQAASYGFALLTEDRRSAFLKSALKTGVAKPSEVHSAIDEIGGRCFVTTNYDSLMEMQLHSSRGVNAMSVVTGAQTLEIASLVRARAEKFIFKAHGDIGDMGSIVFTRENYRELHGSRRNVTEALKTLLVSRPVIYVGFGLRDPDFLAALDALATTYGSLPQDHFALVADVFEDEIVHWRTSTGIQLVPYRTDRAAKSEKRHSELTDILRELVPQHVEQKDMAPSPAQLAVGDGDSILSCVRFASRQINLSADSADRFSVGYSVVESKALQSNFLRYRQDTAELLASVDVDLLLTGTPGSGKSTAVKQAIHRLGLRARAKLLDDYLGDDDNFVLPVLMELRSYDGSLAELLDRSLASDLPTDQLISRGSLAIFLDGLNEVPVSFLESGHFRRDLQTFLEVTTNCKRIFTARLHDDWTDLDVVVAKLDVVGRVTVETILTDQGVSAIGNEPVLDLLARPLFLNLVADGVLAADDLTNVHSVYAGLIDSWNADIDFEWGQVDPLEELMGPLAHSLVGRGIQLFAPDEFTDPGNSSGVQGIRDSRSRLLDSLLRNKILIADGEGKVAFWHHSVIEYFAAREMSSRIASDRSLITIYLASRTWDHALLLSLGFMEDSLAEMVFETIVEIDPALAMRGISYLDADQVKWSKILLRHLPTSERAKQNHLHVDVTLSLDLVDELLAVASLGDSLGGSATAVLFGVQQKFHPGIDLQFILEKADDYNYWSAFARGIEKYESDSSVRELVNLVSTLVLPEGYDAEDESSEFFGLAHNLSDVVGRQNPFLFEALFRDYASQGALLHEVFVIGARDQDSAFAKNLLAQLVLDGHESAVFALYSSLRYRSPNNKLELELGRKVARHILSTKAQVTDATKWRLELLGVIGSVDERVSDLIAAEARRSKPFMSAALFSLAKDNERASRSLQTPGLFEDLENSWLLTVMDKFDFALHPEIYSKLLYSGSPSTITNLAESMMFSFFDTPVRFPIADVGSLVALMESNRKDMQFLDRLGSLLSRHADETAQKRAVEIFNEQRSDLTRRILSEHVLPECDTAAIESLSSESLEWLVADLSANRFRSWGQSFLGVVVSEEFVESRLLPLMEYPYSPDDHLQVNLREALSVAERRHSKRYFDDSGRAIHS